MSFAWALKLKERLAEDFPYDIEAYCDGKEEFVNRYGGSELVMEKYEILVDYIEGELGVKI